MLKIVTIPHKVLTSPTKKIQKIDRRIKKLVVDMEETLLAQRDPQGVGLAATQVGLDLSLFIIKIKPQSPTSVYINPKIVAHGKELVKYPKKDDESEEKMEGCLSIPRIWAPLRRPSKVKLEYLDLEGKKHTAWFSGFNSIIVQHEVDHLNGILFTQRCLEENVQLYEENGDKLEKMKA